MKNGRLKTTGDAHEVKPAAMVDHGARCVKVLVGRCWRGRQGNMAVEYFGIEYFEYFGI